MMAVPQLPLSFSEVKAEFGGSHAALSAYLRGGAIVPIQTLGNIPTALPLALSDFAGAVYPAALTYAGSTVNNGFTVTTQVVAADLSTATIVLGRTKIVNGGSTWFETSELDLLFNITGAISPSIVLRLPATQPRDGAGYWKQISGSSAKRVCTPATLLPNEDYASFEHYWHMVDTSTTYQGELRVNTLIPLGNGPTPPQTTAAMLGAQAAVRVTLVWTMNIGTTPPPGVQMTWNTRNVSDTFVEFPVVIDVYDAGVLRASYPMTLHVELNALTTFNPS